MNLKGRFDPDSWFGFLDQATAEAEARVGYRLRGHGMGIREGA
jgi:hypothetical protein